MPDNKQPLYSLTVGEFIDLSRKTLQAALEEIQQQQPPNTEQEEHFTIRECADFLHCSLVSIHNYKRQGMPYYRVGRKVLFKKSEVLEFMHNTQIKVCHRAKLPKPRTDNHNTQGNQ